REAESSDVPGLGVVRADDAPEAEVQAEAPQGAQPRGKPVDLHVPVQRLLADAAGCHAFGFEATGELGDRLLEAIRDGREGLVVARDQRRVGLGGEVVGKVKRAGSQRVHVNSSNLRSLTGHPAGLVSCEYPLALGRGRWSEPGAQGVAELRVGWVSGPGDISVGPD